MTEENISSYIAETFFFVIKFILCDFEAGHPFKWKWLCDKIRSFLPIPIFYTFANITMTDISFIHPFLC